MLGNCSWSRGAPEGGYIYQLLSEYDLLVGKTVGNIVMDKNLPEDVPNEFELQQLQRHAGELNWLATRTRPDIAYAVSLLASSLSKSATWSATLAKKVLRYLSGTREAGLVYPFGQVELQSASPSARQDASELYLDCLSDAGFAGV